MLRNGSLSVPQLTAIVPYHGQIDCILYLQIIFCDLFNIVILFKSEFSFKFYDWNSIHFVVTRLRVGQRRIVRFSARKRGVFPSPNVQKMCSSQSPIQWLPEVSSLGVKRPRREAVHLHPVPSLKMIGVINPLLLMSSWPAQERSVLSLQMLCTSRMSCVRSLTLLRCTVKDALGKKHVDLLAVSVV